MNKKNLILITLFIISLFLNTNAILASTQSMDVALTITDGPPSQPPSQQGATGGTGGSGSSGGSKSKQKVEIPAIKQCEENWICTDWSGCVNNMQYIQCYDSNECGTIQNKPPLNKICEEEIKEEIPKESIQETPRRPSSLWVLGTLIVVSYYIIYITHKKTKKKKLKKHKLR